MKKFLTKLVIWIFAVSAFCIAALCLVDHRFIAGKKKMFIEQKGKRNVDLMIIGSSRAEFIIDPQRLSEEHTIYNGAYAGHGLPSNYFLLKLVVEKYGYKIKNVLLSTDEFNFNGSIGFSRKFRDDFFVDNLDDNEVFEAYKKYRGATFAHVLKHFPQASVLVYGDFRKLVKNIPSMLHPFSEQIKESNEASLNIYATTKGFAPITKSNTIKNDHIKKSYVIEEDDLHYFLKIVALCKKHKINMALFRAPVLYCQNSDSRLFDQFISNFTKQNNIPFYDYKCTFQNNKGYYDNTHPSITIAEQLSLDLKEKVQPLLTSKQPGTDSATLVVGLLPGGNNSN